MGNLAWLVPPLLGLVAFVGARAVLPAAVTGPAKREPAESSAVRGKPSEVASAIEQAKREEEAAAASVGDFPVDNEALKAEFLKLKQKLKSWQESGSWYDLVKLPGYQLAWKRYQDMAVELGRRMGADAEKWILEVEPGSVVWVIEGWAEVDPVGAFRSVVSSDRRRPCGDDLLLELVAAQKDGIGLKEAVLQVPWHLFDSSVYYPSVHGDMQMREIPYSLETNLRDWIDSGAALAMAEKGVQISRFFWQWAKQDPEGALENWENWPDERPQVAKARMLEILQATADDDALVARFRTAWDKMPAEGQRKVAEVYEAYRKGLPSEWQDPNDKVNQAFQFLEPASSATPSK